MSDKRIVYRNASGGVSVVIPANNTSKTIEEIASHSVPTGLAYKIVDMADVPSDRSARSTWTVDEADLTDGVGGEEGITE